MESYDNLQDVARSFGISPALLESRRIDTAPQIALAIDMLGANAQRHDAKRTSTECKDAATTFFTNQLAEVLAPVQLPGQDRFRFVPGRTGAAAPLLPVIKNMPVGKTSIEYDVFALTGEAQVIGAGGVKQLRKSNAVEDQKSQRGLWYGSRFGWDKFELWQASHTKRKVESERRDGARQAMDVFLEGVGGFGDLGRMVPGFWNTGSAISLDVIKSFGDPTLTRDEMLEQMGIIEILWDRMNPQRMVNGVTMPKTHMVNMLRIFSGVASEGHSAWKLAKEIYTWLNNIVTDDRLLTAGPNATPIWQLWSSDAKELYLEAAPAPALYGPFNDEFDVDFITINQSAGVVNKDPTRIVRVHMPTV